MIAMNMITLLLSGVQSSPLVKRAGVGYAASGVRLTYYGSDYTTASNGQYIGDVPPYAPYGIGACGQEPVDKNFFVAMNNGAFDGSCGLCAKITYGGACIVAPIVDRCPGCGSGLDVSLFGFGQLVGGEARAKEMGVANVDFEIVVCPSYRASTGSPSTSNVDPCSGSSSRSSSGSAVSVSNGVDVAESQSSSSSTTSSTTLAAADTTTTSSSTFTATTSSSTKSSSSTATVGSNKATSTNDISTTTVTSTSSQVSSTDNDNEAITAATQDSINPADIEAVAFKGPQGLSAGFV
jgi:hypothetical protein